MHSITMQMRTLTTFIRWVLLLCSMGLMVFDTHAVTPMVAAGDRHSIGLSAAGNVYVWGSNAIGQLGLGEAILATVPQAVPGLNLGQGSGKSRVASGAYGSVTVKSDGSVWAWGDNQFGEIGDGTTMIRT